MTADLLSIPVMPDFEAFRANILRQGTPRRVHYLELYEDREIKDALVERYDLEKDLDRNDPAFAWKREIAIQKFLGYDFVCGALEPVLAFPESAHKADALSIADTTAVEGQSRGLRAWADEHDGPIQSWKDFEDYAWPDPAKIDYSSLDWAEKKLEPNLKVYLPIFSLFEYISWFFGYEKMCYLIFDEPELVEAAAQKIGEIRLKQVQILADYNCVGMFFGGDDMGFKTSLLVPKNFLLKNTFPWYKKIVAYAHSKGKLCVLHSCGKIDLLMEELIEDVGFDGRQSYEDVIMPVPEVKRRWGSRIAVIGGLDMDFIVRATPDQIRQRVRDVLTVCMPGGGFAWALAIRLPTTSPLKIT